MSSLFLPPLAPHMPTRYILRHSPHSLHLTPYTPHLHLTACARMLGCARMRVRVCARARVCARVWQWRIRVSTCVYAYASMRLRVSVALSLPLSRARARTHTPTHPHTHTPTHPRAYKHLQQRTEPQGTRGVCLQEDTESAGRVCAFTRWSRAVSKRMCSPIGECVLL